MRRSPTSTEPAASPSIVQRPPICPSVNSSVRASSKWVTPPPHPIGSGNTLLRTVELGPRVRVEVHLAQAVAGKVRVDLRRPDVGMAEHLLQRAQVAAAGQQVGGERVSERMRAHPVLEPGAAGVALNDLVETLTREPTTA